MYIKKKKVEILINEAELVGAGCEEAEQSTPDLEELEERAKPKKEQEYFSLSVHMVHLVIFRVRSQNFCLLFIPIHLLLESSEHRYQIYKVDTFEGCLENIFSIKDTMGKKK